MKILLVHNDYGAYSGEEAVVDRMAEMFAGLGHAVAQLRRSTAGVRDSLGGKISAFLNGIYSPSGCRAMREIIRREKPDIVNVHNLYPFINPAALRECKRAGIPVVMTVHNYRLICPTGLFMRGGRPCEVCLEKGNEWGCLAHNCEGSRMKSLGYAARNWRARIQRDYRECVDVFACLTDFQRRKLIQAGFPPEKIVVIPNSSDIRTSPSPLSPSLSTLHSHTYCLPPTTYITFSGRLSREKGIDLITEVARRHPELSFRFAGAVRDKELASNLPPNVSLLGHLSGERYADFIRNSRFLVMASRCYEGFPMAILEAAAYGKPVVVPDHGGFTEIVGKGPGAIGRLFAPGDADALEAAIVNLWNNPGLCRELGERAFEKLRSEYSSQAVAEKWQGLISRLVYGGPAAP